MTIYKFQEEGIRKNTHPGGQGYANPGVAKV
jgi:hypothetical protein